MVEGRVEMRSRKPRRGDDADLWFADPKGKAVYPKVGHNGHHCPACDTVVVLGEAGSEVTCFECGTSIAESADCCPSCGWSWK